MPIPSNGLRSSPIVAISFVALLLNACTNAENAPVFSSKDKGGSAEDSTPETNSDADSEASKNLPGPVVATPAPSGNPTSQPMTNPPAPGPTPPVPSGPVVESLKDVKKSAGCGKQPAAEFVANTYVKRVIDVPAVPLRGDGEREFYVKIPAKYDATKPYRVIFVAPGCGGSGSNPPFNFTNAAAAEGGVIQIGLHREDGVSQFGPCFDDKRTDSIEYMYFEKTLEFVKSNFCADENRVFVTGHSSGAWLSNQLGCVYGSKLIRAIGPASGGLATAAADGKAAAPPCKDSPTPGIWVHNEGDMDNKVIGSQRAIERALVANHCTDTSFKGPREPWQAPGSGTNCEKYTTCPAESPIVFCHPAGGGHPPPSFASAAIWQFFQSF